MNIDPSILDRYAQGTCSLEEQQLVEAWYAQLGAGSELDEARLELMVKRLDQRIQQELMSSKGTVKPMSARNSWKLWTSIAAAAVLLIAGTWFFMPDQGEKNVAEIALLDVKAPIASNSILVMENNNEVDLDKLKIGDTLRANGYLVYKNTSGEISYEITDPAQKTIYNTVKTKAGGMSSMQLADGSKVWINSNSEIRYPVTFASDYREVSLCGEAYFEIEKAADRPFYVRSKSHTIKVLGTRFNVQNYNKAYVTTLLEGNITLTNKTSLLGQNENLSFPIRLKPNQSYDGKNILQEDNANKAIDWKEGYFDFSDMTLAAIADKLTNWYDMKIEIAPDLKEKRVYGQISRKRSLREVLDMIKQVLPVEVEWNTNKITITNQKK